MRLPERSVPVRMRRIAVIVPRTRIRGGLVVLADSGTVDLSGPLGSGEGPALEALRRLDSRRGRQPPAHPMLARESPDLEQLEHSGSRDVLAGEVELERRTTSAVRHGAFALFVGWAPEPELERLSVRLQPLGASLVTLRNPPGSPPPTLLAPAPAADPFRPLLTTYGMPPYEDVDPTVFVAVTYALMFGMMFGDVGDGLLIVLAALVLRRTRNPRLRGLHKVWPMILAPGVGAIVFGFLYGEFFGPTKVLPVLWLDPLDAPTRLLAVAIALGAVLLACGYVIGIVNRWREGGAALALTAGSGVPGLALLIGAGVLALGVTQHVSAAFAAGMVIVVAALAALTIGLRGEAGRGAAGTFEVLISLFDAIVRVFSNVFSFARLAAFGLMHAAIGQVVLHAAGGLLGTPVGDLAAAAVFLVGSAVAFALEGLVVAVQALRLEYYELFSRVFAREGRPFRPWRLPLTTIEEAR